LDAFKDEGKVGLPANERSLSCWCWAGHRKNFKGSFSASHYGLSIGSGIPAKWHSFRSMVTRLQAALDRVRQRFQSLEVFNHSGILIIRADVWQLVYQAPERWNANAD